MIKKVLVAGGAGYIGGAVTDFLIKNKIKFTVYDSLLYEHQYLKPSEFIFGDIRDKNKLKKLLPKYSHIIWLAAIVGDAACQINPPLTVAINQESVKWLAENFKGRIIFASTCSVYGKHNALLDENAPLNPLSLYAKTKLAAEKFLKKKNALILRLGTAFGLSDYFSRLRMDLVVNYMTANALTKGFLTVFGGNQWRPLIHVKDIGKIMVDNLDKPITGIFNLASTNIQIKELAKKVSQITACKIKYTAQKFEDERNYHVSVKKAKKAKIFNPYECITIEGGIKEVADLIKSGRIKYTENDIYFNERHISNLMKNGQFN